METQRTEQSSDVERAAESRAQFILDRLGLTWENLRGKRIVDLGAGQGEFARAARSRGIEVVPVEKHPERWEDEGGLPQDLPYEITSADALPFPDQSFDLVISHAAPPVISETKDEVRAVIEEAKRVLKPGGELRFGVGNLNAGIFADGELFTPEEDEQFSMAERIQRIREKSLELLHSIDPIIEEVPLTHPATEPGYDDHLYRLRMPAAQ